MDGVVGTFRQALMDLDLPQYRAETGEYRSVNGEYRSDCPECGGTRCLTFRQGIRERSDSPLLAKCHGGCTFYEVIGTLNYGLRQRGLPELDVDMFFKWEWWDHFDTTPTTAPPVEKSDTQSDDSQGGSGAAQGSSTTGNPKYKGRWFSDIEDKPLDWLWDGWLPLGVLVVLDGDPDMGKSTVIIDVGARTTTGSAMPDESGPNIGAANIIVMSAEDEPERIIKPRLRAAGTDLSRVFFLDVAINNKGEEVEILLPSDLEALEQAITDLSAKLVIIDVLVSYLGDQVKTSVDQSVRRALRPLSKIAQRTQASIVCLRHFTKGATGGRDVKKAIHAGGGSVGITGAGRAGLVVGYPPKGDDDITALLGKWLLGESIDNASDTVNFGLLQDGRARIIAVAKNNYWPTKPPSLAYELVNVPDLKQPRVRWLGELNVTADQLVEQKQPERVTELDRATTWLKGVLANGMALPSAEIKAWAEMDDIAMSTLHKARKKLGIVVEEDRSKQGNPTTWRLP